MVAITGIYRAILHTDMAMYSVIRHYGLWAYIILFLAVLFNLCSPVFSFIPGDSILIVAGAVCAGGVLDIRLVIAIIASGAVIGNLINYSLGEFLGPGLFHHGKPGIFREENLNIAHDFYKKHGGIMVMAGLFLPFIRSFVPFIAGIAGMNRTKFVLLGSAGSVLWVSAFSLAGFFFGRIPFFEKNLLLMITAILVILFIALPLAVHIIKTNMARRAH